MATHSSILAQRIPRQRALVSYIVHGVTKSWTRLSDFTFLTFFHTRNGGLTTQYYYFTDHYAGNPTVKRKDTDCPHGVNSEITQSLLVIIVLQHDRYKHVHKQEILINNQRVCLNFMERRASKCVPRPEGLVEKQQIVIQVEKNSIDLLFIYGLLRQLSSKESPCKQETQVGSLGWEDSLEKKMATHSSILALRIPWTEEPGRQQSIGLQRVRHD